MQTFSKKTISPYMQGMIRDFINFLHSLKKNPREGKLNFTERFSWLANRTTEWQDVYKGNAGNSPLEFIKNLARASGG